MRALAIILHGLRSPSFHRWTWRSPRVFATARQCFARASTSGVHFIVFLRERERAFHGCTFRVRPSISDVNWLLRTKGYQIRSVIRYGARYRLLCGPVAARPVDSSRWTSFGPRGRSYSHRSKPRSPVKSPLSQVCDPFFHRHRGTRPWDRNS